MSTDTVHRGLRVYTRLVCVATLILIFMGGLVTSMEAGLSVPDWPTTYGQNMFLFPYSAWQGNIFYEHSHRLMASLVGVLMIGLAIWLTRSEGRRWVRTLGHCALLAVVVQGLLGGLTVKLQLPTAVSVCHGVLAQTFFMLTIVIAYSQSRERVAREATDEERSSLLTRQALLVVSLIYVQLIVAAIMRHSHSGLAVYDFPTMAGQWWPTFDAAMLETINQWRRAHDVLGDVTMFQVGIHALHRIIALIIAVVLIVVTVTSGGKSAAPAPVSRTIWLLDLLLVAQISLGIASVLTLKHPWVATVHVAVGALMLGVSTVLTLRAFPVTMRAYSRRAGESVSIPSPS